MNNISLAKEYFEASNESDMKTISHMMSDSTTYSSPSTGLYLWVENIITMQGQFHASFEYLSWEVTSYFEEKPWIVLCCFNFRWKKKNWEDVSFSGKEYIIVFEWKIQHIEIQSK